MVKGVSVVCRHGRCALRDGVVYRKARVVGVGWSACHPSALSLLSQPPVLSTMLSLLSLPPVSPTALSLLSQPPVSPTALSLLSHPPVSPTMLSILSHPLLFAFSHFRCFPSRLWRTPRTLSPCTSKYSCRVPLRHLDSQCLTQMSCLPRYTG